MHTDSSFVVSVQRLLADHAAGQFSSSSLIIAKVVLMSSSSIAPSLTTPITGRRETKLSLLVCFAWRALKTSTSTRKTYWAPQPTSGAGRPKTRIATSSSVLSSTARWHASSSDLTDCRRAERNRAARSRLPPNSRSAGPPSTSSGPPIVTVSLALVMPSKAAIGCAISPACTAVEKRAIVRALVNAICRMRFPFSIT